MRIRLKENGDCSRGSTAWAVGVCLMVLGALFAGASPAVAGVSEASCIKQAAGNVTCTANDVRIGTLEVVGDPVTCDPTSTDLVTVTLKATIVSGPERYDVALWINQSGGLAKDDAGGTCYREILTPLGDYPTADTQDCDSVSGPYANGDDDSCGDIPKTSGECANTVEDGSDIITEYTFTAEILCSDSNDNGQVDASSCTSWSQNADDILCNGVLDAIPGAPSKCSCESVEIGGIFTGCQTNADCNDNVACTVDVCTIEGSVGTCSNTPDDNVCNDLNSCTTNTCNATTGCQSTNVPAGEGTCDDGSTCTSYTGDPDSPDACDGNGECAGNPVTCADDGNSCTTEICSEANSCTPQNVPAGEGTCDDGSTCTSYTGDPDSPDACDGNGECAGNPVTCADDGNSCTTEICSEANSCTPQNVPAGEGTCDDGSTCTSYTGDPDSPDACDGNGECAGNPVTCDDDGNSCTTEICSEANSCTPQNVPAGEGTCDDGSTCTSYTGDPDSPDACDGNGECAGNPVTCADDGNSCTTEICSEANSCTPQNVPAGEGTCDDGSTCTSYTGDPDSPDACDGNGECAGNPVTCADDGNSCTTEICSEANSCTPQNVPAGEGTCDDGSTCTSYTGDPDSPDACDGNGECAGNPVTCADDGNSCTTEICSEANSCTPQNVPAGEGTCDDGSTCTSYTGDPDSPDACDGNGECAGNPVTCADDGNSCTTEICSEANSCTPQNVPAGEGTCDDGSTCTSYTGDPDSPDACDGNGECAGNPVTCDDDGNSCTTEICSEANSCTPQNVPAGEGTCDDGSTCTSYTGDPDSPDACDGNGECAGNPVTCADDGNSCTTEICSEANSCTPQNVPAGEGTCDDGSTCTSYTGDPDSPDACDGNGECAGNPVTCDDDGNSCTTEICSEANSCTPQNVPAGEGTCDDGSTCTSYTGDPDSPDACDGNGECAGNPVTCADDNNSCTTEICSEANSCTPQNVPAGEGTCDDGSTCTSYNGVEGGDDACDGDGGCAGDEIVCDESDVEGDGQCNASECDTSTGFCADVPDNEDGECTDGEVCTDSDVCTDGVCGGTDVELTVTVIKNVINDTCTGANCLDLTAGDFTLGIAYNNGVPELFPGDSAGTTFTACSGTDCGDGIEVDVTEDLTDQPPYGDLDAFYAASFSEDCSDVVLACGVNRTATCTVTNDDLHTGQFASLRLSGLTWSGSATSLAGGVNIQNASSDPDQTAEISNLDILLEQRVGKGKNQEWVEIAHPADCTFTPSTPFDIAGSGENGNEDVTFVCNLADLSLARGDRLRLTVHAYVDATHVDFFHATLGGRLN